MEQSYNTFRHKHLNKLIICLAIGGVASFIIWYLKNKQLTSQSPHMIEMQQEVLQKQLGLLQNNINFDMIKSNIMFNDESNDESTNESDENELNKQINTLISGIDDKLDELIKDVVLNENIAKKVKENCKYFAAESQRKTFKPPNTTIELSQDSEPVDIVNAAIKCAFDSQTVDT
eukprot:441328_1